MSLAQISVDIDEADAVVLQESLLKTRSLVSQISQSLNKISDSTSRSEQLLRPIVDKNKRLSVFQRNVNESLLAVSNVQGIASEASIYESRLSERIDNVKTYITTIHKSEDILEKLTDNENGEYRGISENLSKTILDSEFKLKAFFKDLIAPDSQSFDPQIFMNQRKPFPYMSNAKIRDVGLILGFFNENDKSIDNLFIESRSNVITESLAFLEPFTKHTRKGDKVPYERGSNGIGNYTEAYLGFLSNEFALLEDIFKGSDSMVPIFQTIIQRSVDNYAKIINNILDSISKSLTNDGLLSFELIDNITKVLSMLRSKSPEPYPNLQAALERCRTTARSLFKELLIFTDQRVGSLLQLPQDSGVSEATVEVMSKARKYSEYKDGELSVMNGFKAGSWIPSQPKPQWLTTFSSISQTTAIDDSDPKQLLSSFYSDVIDALIVSLEIKAQQFIKKKQSMGYFLITNITLVEQIISRSELKNILDSVGVARLEKLKKRALNFFLTGWKQVASYLLDVNVVGKLSSKDREAIKEKFRNFNSEFDELVRSYKAYNITDQSLKKFLSKEISFISPLYKRFYDKHSSGDFTKHTDKYIKYSKPEFDKILESLGK